MYSLLFSTALAFSPYDLSSLEAILERTRPHRALRDLSVYPSIPSSAYKTAASGEIATGLDQIPGYSAKLGWGVAVFDTPIEVLFPAINDEMQHTGLTPVNFTQIVSGKPCVDGRQVMMILPLTMMSDRWWVTTQSTNDTLRDQTAYRMAEISWVGVSEYSTLPLQPAVREKVKDMVHLPFTQGAWLLIKLDEQHTLAEYHSWSDPGGYMPAGVASTFAAGSISTTFEAMDQFAKKNVTTCVF